LRAGTPRHTGKDLSLTPRQKEVLALLVQGKSNKALRVAEGTIKAHVSTIFRTLGVSNCP
jgi:DNA-binding NarL/FixJ family response regulator